MADKISSQGEPVKPFITCNFKSLPHVNFPPQFPHSMRGVCAAGFVFVIK